MNLGISVFKSPKPSESVYGLFDVNVLVLVHQEHSQWVVLFAHNRTVKREVQY